MSVALAAGADPEWIARTHYDSNSLARVRIFGAVLNGMTMHAGGRVALLTITQAIARELGGTYDDTEGLINFPLTVKEVAAVAETAPYRTPVGWLRCFRGIDTLSAMILIAEIVDFHRFRHPRDLMAYLGLVPSEYSSADTHRRGGITKTGNTHARRALVEAAWHYRHRPTAGGAIGRRTTDQPPHIVSHAWRAQQRLHRRYRHLIGHGKRPPVAVVAIARELVGFLWAAMTRPAVAA